MEGESRIIVAGHICLDIIPNIKAQHGGLPGLFVPGKLVDVGEAVMATGGAVSNTGLALHRLGRNVRLMGKIGEDPMGRTILELLSQSDPKLAEGMIVSDSEHSSYTIVVSPPGVDRVFLHHTGTNDTFTSSDVNPAELAEADLFHFGYPPLMKNMYAADGLELKRLFQAAKQAGATTSLDLARPDPDSDAGQADWIEILSGVLPHVDLFLPSLEEILYMLDRPRYEQMNAAYGADLLAHVDGDLLAKLSGRLITMGACVVGLKMGEYGFYVRTTSDETRLEQFGRSKPTSAWLARELLTTCYQVNVVGTTGAGDCTIAGFLNGFVEGLSPEEALKGAVAVGACNVERADATSGVPTWTDVRRRMQAGWVSRKQMLDLQSWSRNDKADVWVGPNDKHRRERD